MPHFLLFLWDNLVVTFICILSSSISITLSNLCWSSPFTVVHVSSVIWRLGTKISIGITIDFPLYKVEGSVCGEELTCSMVSPQNFQNYLIPIIMWNVASFSECVLQHFIEGLQYVISLRFLGGNFLVMNMKLLCQCSNSLIHKMEAMITDQRLWTYEPCDHILKYEAGHGFYSEILHQCNFFPSS